MTETMQAVSDLVAELSPEERSLLASLLAPAPEPTAIVGIGCRFPGGADNPGTFWRNLEAGADAIREVPRERWDVDAYYDPDPEASGKMITRYGGFLDCVDGFDPQFFEITPREAAHMDPQQRLLLEVAWEALEDAGQPPGALRQSRTGVFVGFSWRDYELLLSRGEDLGQVDPHTLTGDLTSVLAGRLSYALGLEGPSLAVDTACSSSLVAIHLACESLNRGQCNLALAGGVNLILAPDGFVKLSKTRALSADGRCRTFDVRASGFARGEGAGVVVLKRLGDAERAGDRIWAVIRGSAVNHDGRSAGLTAPNGLAQRDVIRAALESARVSAPEVGYIEAHGTATPLGDPIELEALKEVFGQPRADGLSCPVGSVKTNLGHLEAAAGVAGVIKAALSLWHGAIPAHLHWTQMNPRVSLEGTPLCIPAELRPWPRGAKPRIAGVSAFGISGTNAHVVLAEGPEPEPLSGSGDRRPSVVTLSAKTDAALGELARRTAAALAADQSMSLADVAITANLGRSQHPFRAAVVASSPAEAEQQLSAFAQGERLAGVVTGRADTQPKVAFVVPAGIGVRPGTGRDLYESEPAFREALEECDAVFLPMLDVSLLHALFPRPGEPAAPLSDGVERAARFALAMAQGALWRALGVEPDFVLGAQEGELAAAALAGVLSLEQAGSLVAGGPLAGDPRPLTRVGFACASTGRLLGPEEAVDRARWSGSARGSEAFEAGLQALRREGCAVFAALGSGGDLPAEWVSALSGGGGDEEARLLEGVAALSVRGVPVDWAEVHERRPGRRISLPTYPFQRQSCWLPARPQVSAEPTPRSEPAAGQASPQLTERQKGLLYELTWLPALDATQRETRPLARYLLLAGASDLADRVAAHLDRRGSAPVLIRANAEDESDVLVDALRALDAAAGSNAPFAGIVDLRAADAPANPQIDLAPDRAADALALARAVVSRSGRPAEVPRLWIVTRGAAVVDEREGAPGFAQAPLWGIARVLAGEHPDLAGGLVDLDPVAPANEDSMLADHLLLANAAPEAAFRGEERLEPRIVRCGDALAGGRPVAIRSAASYLVTGGLGALGLAWAGWMVRSGARHLVLAGRRVPSAADEEALAALRTQGAQILAVQTDVAKVEEVAALFQRIDEAMPPLAGIIHAAGVSEDATLSNADEASLARVLAPKVQGSANLWEAARDRDLDFVVFFSSVSALLGNPGQVSYAAANAFLDAFAAHLRSSAARAVSIAWGPFSGAGMAKDALAGLGKRWGLSGLDPEEALGLFENLLRMDCAQIVAMDLELGRRAGKTPLPPLLAGLEPAPEVEEALADAQAAGEGNELSKRIRKSAPDRRLGLLIKEVTAVAQNIMGLDPSLSLNPDQRLDELGMDSLIAIDVVRGLGEAFGVMLPVTMAMEHPTVSAMAHYLEREIGAAQ